MEKSLIEAYTVITQANECLAEVSPEELQDIDESRLSEEMTHCEQAKANSAKLYQQAVSLYSGKFGKPIRAAGEMDADQVQRARAVMNDSALAKLLFMPGHGLLAKKPKKEDYILFCQAAEVVTEYYNRRYDVLDAVAAVRELCSAEMRGQILKGLASVRENISSEAEKWKTLPGKEPRSREIYLGKLGYPVNRLGLGGLRDTGLINEKFGDTWMDFPFSYRADRPFSLFVSYEGDTRAGEEKLGRMTRSIMYQIMHSMPAYSYEFLYLDPAHGGKNLEEIYSALSGAVDGNAFQLNEKLYPDSMFRLLTVGGSKDESRDLLKEVERRVSLINSICGGQSVAEYNRDKFTPEGELRSDARGVIPQLFVFWENSHQNLTDDTVQTFLKLADCAEKAGISLVVTSCRETGEAYTKEEQKLTSQDSNRDDLDRIELDREGGSVYFDGDMVDQDADRHLFFNFDPDETEIHSESYLSLVSQAFQPTLDVDTTYKNWIDLSRNWGEARADDEVVIPVGINDRNEVASIAIGCPDGAHALLAGSNGCGKSSFLHAIINGVITRYKPTDVQLWLSDYKTAEFRRYMENTPPHVGYVGVGRSPEYTFHFLDKIYEEYEHRLSLFGTITSVKEYRQVHGPDSLPRILVIVDEFHVMSNHIKENPDYKMKLSSLVRECRALGINFLLSDQTCGVGLQGLTEDAKLQLTRRMAMKTTTEEYNAVFNISNARSVIPTQQNYEVVLSRMTKQINDRGAVENRVFYEHCKTLYISPDVRTEVADKAIALWGPAQNPLFVEEFHRSHPYWGDITDDSNNPLASRGVPIFLGTPLSLEKTFRFYMIPNTNENMMSVVPFDEIQCSILLSTLESLRRQENSQIYILANPNDFVFVYCEQELNRIAAEDPRVHVATELSDICGVVADQCREIETRRRQRSFASRNYLFWVGLYDICEDMNEYPENRPDGSRTKPKANNDFSAIAASLDALFADQAPAVQPAAEPEIVDDEGCYNAYEDIRQLVEQGPRRDIHNLVFYSAYVTARKTRCARTENFVHKIALGISKDDATDYLGQSRAMLNAEGKPLGNDTAAYFNGRVATHFMPFVSDLEEAIHEQTKL